MPRKLPTHYISPSAVSITPNANGSQNDLAVYVAKGAKIKVYLPAAGIDMQNAAFQEWTFSGRNRRLADSGKPYTIYARLSIDNKSDGYLVFSAQVKDGGVWYDKYGSHKTSESPEDIQVYSLAKGKEDECYVSLTGGYYYVRLGWVTLPDDGKRSMEFDTGILGTEQYNAEWNLDPDSASLRVELTGSIDGEDAGERPYVPWGKTLNLQAKLVEGWYTGDAGAVDQWTIVRDTGDEEADAAWNQGPSAQAFMESGNILFEHQEGGTDDFNNSVAAVFTVTAWKKEEVSSDSGDESGQPVYAALASNSMTVVTEASEYISKLKDDTAAGIITFLKGLVSRGDVVVNGLLTAYNAVMNTIKSSNYTGDGVTDSGWLLTNDYAGSSRLVVDYLYARKKAVFESLEIKELQFTSGDLAQSLASATIERTDYLQVDEQGEETILGYSDRKTPWTLKGFLMRLSSRKPYALARNKKIRINLKPEDLRDVNRVRCYFLAKDENKKIFNLWKVNDLARCQTFNIDNIDRETYAGETHKAGNVYWWRLVKKISTETVTVDGKEYHYFDVAYGFDAEQEANRIGVRTAWCDILSDLPAAGDKVVQFGNTDNPARMNIIVSEVNGEGNADAPAIKSYRGVYTFNTDECWWGGESCRKMMLSPSSGVEFYAPSFKFITEYGIERTQVERGAWLAIPFEEDTEHQTFPDYSDDILDENGNFVSRSDGSPKNYVRKCRYYDRVEHKGSTWLCTIAESHYWRKYDNGVWSKITDAQYQALPQEEKDKCEEVRNYTTDEPSKASNDWTVSAERGQDGSFKSRVFCRTNINIKKANVRGGSYDNPIPTLTKIGDDVVQITWEDGVPQGTEMLWSTVCTFYGDGSNSGWSKPSQETDTETLDIEFSPNAIAPSAPVGTAADRNTQDIINARQAQGWYDPSRLPVNQQMIWRAECKIKNGVYETKDGNPAWVIARIKGEKGTSVREVKPYYAKQSPESYNGVPPQDGWEESIAALGTIAEGWYVWTKNVISFTDNVESTTTYTVSKWGIDGDGIENIETKFYENSLLLTQRQLEGKDPVSGTTYVTESDWKEYGQLALTKGDYIYTRTKITYDKGDTPTISYQVNRLGQDGVGYVATEEYYVLGNSQTDAPSGHPDTENQPYKKYTAAEWQQIEITGGWSESRPTYQGDANKYLWNFEVSFDTDGNAMVTRPICIGNYAKGIVSIIETYAISAYAVAPQAGSYPSDITTWTDEAHDCAPTDAKPYQWNKTVTSYSDGTSDTFYHVSAVKGTRGLDGKSVFYDEEHSSIGYAYSSMGTPEAGRDYPSDITRWYDNPPAVQKGKYLWTKDVTAYNNGGTLVYTTTYGVQYQPNDGESVEIDSSRTFIKYCRQTKSQYTGQHPSDSEFSLTYPTYLGQGDYLWILNQVAYVGVANPLKSYSVSMLGTDGRNGDKGADGYTTHFAYATSADGSQNFSTTNFVGATYIGTYRDQNAADSTNYRDYVWTPWKGDKGDKGKDGWMINANPANVIITQSLGNNTSSFSSATVSFVAKKGSANATIASIGTPTSIQFYVSKNGNTVVVSSPKTHGSPAEYYTEGSFTVTISVTDPDTGSTVSFNVTVLCYANLLGTWKQSVEAGEETIAASKIEYVFSASGSSIESIKKDYNSKRNSIGNYETWSKEDNTSEGSKMWMNEHINTAEQNISTVTGKVNGLETSVSQISQTADAINMSVNRGYRNYILNPKATDATTGRGTMSKVNDPVMGNVMNVYNSGSGDFQLICEFDDDNRSDLSYKVVTCYAVVKPKSSGEGQIDFGIWSPNQHKAGLLAAHSTAEGVVSSVFSSESGATAGMVSVGNGWYIIWSSFNARSVFSERKESAGINSVNGSRWLVYGYGVMIGNTCPTLEAILTNTGLRSAGIDISDGTVNLYGDKVTFSNSTGTVSGKVYIDPDNGTIHATDGKFSGEVTATRGSITGNMTIGSGTKKMEIIPDGTEARIVGKDGNTEVLSLGFRKYSSGIYPSLDLGDSSIGETYGQFRYSTVSDLSTFDYELNNSYAKIVLYNHTNSSNVAKVVFGVEDGCACLRATDYGGSSHMWPTEDDYSRLSIGTVYLRNDGVLAVKTHY